jgi:tRNA pseudouridine55 synthase
LKELCGILCINKPAGFTSFDVIAKLRGILKIRRLGHTGTLDPMATGVLPVLVGKAAKACDILPDHDKIYEAGFKLGITTDTQDITGTILNQKNAGAVTEEKLKNILYSFTGNIMQIPPMYSAVSVNGKRLYDLARQGIEVEREARPITVYSLELLSYDSSENTGTLRIACSKGTYIRTLINDIGEALSCGGIMTSLIRTKACGFTLNDCTTFEELQKTADLGGINESILLPVEKLFSGLPAIWLYDEQERMYRNGVKLDINRIKYTDDSDRYCIYGNDRFLGTAYIDREKGELRSEKNFFD